MPTTLNLKPRVTDSRTRDELTDTLAPLVGRRPDEIAYLVNYYAPGLRDRTVGPNSRALVGVSRYYPKLDPKVVVDFEPAPPDHWWFEEKLRFFTELGVIYLGIALRERLTEEAFASRFRERKVAVERHQTGVYDDAPLQELSHLVEGALADPQFEFALNTKAIELAEASITASGKSVRGMARRNVIAGHRRALVLHFRKQLKRGVDPAECYRELTSPTERRGDGQVRPPEPAGPGT